MGPEQQQPASQPVEQTPPSQPMQPVTPPQPPVLPKKGKGKLIGIIAGIVGLILIVTAVLLYFLWWQNPNKMAADAVLSLFVAEKGTAKGEMTLSTDNMKLTTHMQGASNGEDSSVDVALKLTLENAPEIALNVKGVTAKDGSLYFKASGLSDALDTAADAIFDMQMSTSGMTVSESEMREAKEQMRAQIYDMYGSMIEKIEDKWLKVSQEDLESEEDTKCVADALKNFRDDKEQRAELARIYQRNNFIIVQDKVEPRNGATGFEIDLKNDEVKNKLKGFVTEMKDTNIVKELEKCGSSSMSDLEDAVEESATKADAKLVIWVDSLFHKMTAFKFDLKSNEDGQDVAVSAIVDLELGASAKVAIPNDARDVKEVFGKIQESLSSSYDARYDDDFYTDPNYMDV